mgnify:CR=1 FL=1
MVNIKGKKRENTENNGNHLGAKNGKAYAKKVSTAKIILKKNTTLLNQERFFIL